MGKDRVMVCVTGQKNCERLIRAGGALAGELDAEISVVHVAQKGFHFLGNPKEGEALEYLFDISRQVGADMTVLRANDALEQLQSHAVKHGVTHIIVGTSHPGKDFHRRVGALLPHAVIKTVYEE